MPSKRKYPMNHADFSKDKLEPFAEDPDLSFIDKLSLDTKEFVARINAWVNQNRPSSRPEQSDVSNGQGALTDGNSASLSEEIDGMLDVAPDLGGKNEDEAQEQKISKLPLYAGPENLVFGDDPMVGKPGKNNAAEGDYDAIVFFY